ncbi:flippase [Olleya namhaensis]|uniref:Membrane protein involved in the export of O-antigen and teichoic acid n=1 Tax=Olleya namhaensis TaxID=1144750 RepID=A0A1I3JPC3_9FLAO|nr:flippase [Olleya namhaensis]SFI62093.1 Membrane protein involved in the export of O-antigen and teichoic acid [Olleya namhaensis]
MIQKLKSIAKSGTFKNSVIVLILRVLGMALAYASIILISRLFGAETYGRFALLLTTAQFLLLIFSLGLPFAIVKLTSDVNFFSNNTPQNSYLINALKAVFISGLIGGLIIFILSKVIAVYVFKDALLIPYLKTLSYFFVFLVLHKFLVEFIKGKKLFTSYGLLLYVLPYALFFIVFGVMYYKNENTTEESIYLAYLLPFLVLAVIAVFFLPIKRLKTKKTHNYNALFALSFPMLFSAAFIFISNWTDVFMLGAMVSKAEVGIYNAAYKVATIALVIINAINAVLAPKIATLYSQDNLKGIQREVQKATKIITYLSVPIIVLIIIFRKQFLSLFGAEFVQGEYALIIIAIGLLFNAMSGSVGQILNMTKHQHELKRFTIISVLVNIVLNYILIKNFGIIGAAIASLVSNVILNILCIIFIKKEFNFYAFFRF